MATPPKPKPARVKPASGHEPASENTQGLVVPKTAPNTSGAPTNPPVKPETPQEKSLLEKAGELLDKGEIGALNKAKDGITGGIDVLVGTAGGGAAASVIGAIGKGAVEIFFPTNVLDLIPGGKIISGGKKAAKLGETALKTAGKEAAEKAVKEVAQKAAKEAAEKAAKEAAEKEAKQAAGSGGAYSKKSGRSGPCDHLKKGDAGGEGPFRGGSYGGTKQSGIESHHAPPNSASPFPKSQGPALQMSKGDHRMTSSHGHQGADGALHRAEIAGLIANGRWRDALALEIKDIRRVAGEMGERRKYNEAIKEMLAYFHCLEKHRALPK